ncbi:MAG: DsrE family protein [Chromatiaceae bacterium]|nr:DsrE family protein [Chromatiaceae bacterium]
MARLGLLITSDCFASQTLSSVLCFVKASLAQGHQIEHVFLYQAAVNAVAAEQDLPADEPDLSAELVQFCQQQQIDLLFCVTAAEKRGVISQSHPAKAGYIAAGLAEFAMRQANIDKLVQF